MRSECKDLIEKGICDKRFNWIPNNYECECDKSSAVGEYPHYKNCKCKNRLVDKLVEECSENIDENELHQNKMIYNSIRNDIKKYIALVNAVTAQYTSYCLLYFFNKYND